MYIDCKTTCCTYVQFPTAPVQEICIVGGGPHNSCLTSFDIDHPGNEMNKISAETPNFHFNSLIGVVWWCSCVGTVFCIVFQLSIDFYDTYIILLFFYTPSLFTLIHHG